MLHAMHAIQLHRLWAWALATGGHLESLGRLALRWCAGHTGVPAVVVAAVALVVGMRLARRWARFAVEVLLALGLLLFAARAGWVRW